MEILNYRNSGEFGIEYSDLNDKLYPRYHVAVSPNGQQVVTFNTETLELNISPFNSLNTKDQIIKIKWSELGESFGDIRTMKKILWSLAISNTIDNNNHGHSETLIALSCFNESDMMVSPMTINTSTRSEDYLYSNDEKSYKFRHIEDEERGINSVKSKTFIISTLHRKRLLTEINNFGGLVRFLNDDPSQPREVTVVVLNINGIYKTSFELDNVNMTEYSNSKNANNKWLDKINEYFSQLQEFHFPLKVQAELEKLYQSTPCLELLSKSIENDYFLLEDYKDRVQLIEIYNLRTSKLEMVFHQKSDSISTSFDHENPAVTISRHSNLLACCRSVNSVTIYLMENSLEIASQSFPRVEKILSLDFVNNDESLLIIAEEKGNSTPLIIVWDLFNYMDNAIRVLQDITKLSENSRWVRSSGNILLIDDYNGNVLSLSDLIKNILFPPIKSKKELILLDLKKLEESEWTTRHHHTLFNQNGKHENAADSKSVIVCDKEPWVHDKVHIRFSAFLDDEKTTQLFIGKTSVQVWYKKDINSKEQLKYIWVAPKNKTLSIRSLRIGQREFFVNLSIESKFDRQDRPYDINIHWPFKINVIYDACYALRYLYDRRDDPAGLQKQQEFENLVYRTEKLIRQFIKSRPAIWRLIDVRYDVMACLIYSRRIDLVQKILNNDESDTLMRYLHIPRLYQWPKEPKTSDLEIAIRCTEDKRQRDMVMIGYLLDYYSDNAFDNTGWMFTVSQALPLLFDYNLDTYVKDLFSKPIFGAKDIHLDESHINPEDLPVGKLRYITAFNPNTKLVPKKEQGSSHKQRLAALQKVIPGFGRGSRSTLVALRSVPLPDFTVYPDNTKPQEVNYSTLPLQLLRILIWPRGYTITKESELSPFLKVVRKDKDGIALDNPAMEAVIDFKWKNARSHFLRHALLFICFVLLFMILTGAVKNSFVSSSVAKDNRFATFVKVMTYLFYYLGYYLLANEIVQCYHEGWRKYFSVYNFFDLASITIPLVTYTVRLIRESNGKDMPQNQLQQLTVATSFSILIIWIEMFLLLRYFAVTGSFIYIIINIVRNVWPFIAFMGIVVIAHGHAMYLLLHEPEKIGLQANGQSFDLTNNNGEVIGKINQTFDLNSPVDNYFSNFAQSVASVYFWINGRWDQLAQWYFWPVTVLSFVASVLLVVIMQNMLIAFMSDLFDEAKLEGRLAVLKYRSDLIAEYELLEKPFGDTRGNPRHIFYLVKTNTLSRWLLKCEEYWSLRTTSTNEKFHDYNKNNDDDGNISKEGWDVTGLDTDNYDKKNIKSMNRKSRIEFYSSWSTSSMDDDITGEPFSSESTKEKSLETKSLLSHTIEDANNVRNEISLIKGSIKNVENSIDNRLNLLEGKLAEIMNVLNKFASN